MSDENTTTSGDDERDEHGQGEPNGDTARTEQNADAEHGDGGKPAEQPRRKAGESDEDWKARSRTWEDRAKANRKVADEATAERDKAKARLDAVLKALDPDAGKDDDPAETAKRAISERDQHLAELRAERLERAAEKAARRLDVDEVALLDSRGFLASLAKLDPSADGFSDDLTAAINAAVGANARLKNDAKPAAPPQGGAAMGGEQGKGAGSGTSIDDLRKGHRTRRTT